MPIDRRSLIGASLGLTIAAAAQAQAQARLEPAAGAGANDRPDWPPEHLALWPQGRIPGAPARLPAPHDTMNGRPGHRELWLRGVAEPIVAVYRPPSPDGRALMTIPGGGYGFVSVQNEGIEVAETFPKASPCSSSPIACPAKAGPTAATCRCRMPSAPFA